MVDLSIVFCMFTRPGISLFHFAYRNSQHVSRPKSLARTSPGRSPWEAAKGKGGPPYQAEVGTPSDWYIKENIYIIYIYIYITVYHIILYYRILYYIILYVEHTHTYTHSDMYIDMYVCMYIYICIDSFSSYTDSKIYECHTQYISLYIHTDRNWRFHVGIFTYITPADTWKRMIHLPGCQVMASRF